MTRTVLLRLYLLILMAMATSGCELAAGIFKAGVWVGVLAVVVVIGIVFMLFSRSSS
jgi:hypothetical protein